MFETNNNNFEKRVYDYSLKIIALLKLLRKNYIAHTIAKQLLRSATSVSANYFEAKSASSKKDYINFYSYALKSANESVFWLRLLRDSDELTPTQVNPLLDETIQISKILAKSILTMKRNLK